MTLGMESHPGGGSNQVDRGDRDDEVVPFARHSTRRGGQGSLVDMSVMMMMMMMINDWSIKCSSTSETIHAVTAAVVVFIGESCVLEQYRSDGLCNGH